IFIFGTRLVGPSPAVSACFCVVCKCRNTIRDVPSFPTRRSSDLEERLAAAPTGRRSDIARQVAIGVAVLFALACGLFGSGLLGRSEEHTSELQSRENLVCRLLREKTSDFEE